MPKIKREIKEATWCLGRFLQTGNSSIRFGSAGNCQASQPGFKLQTSCKDSQFQAEKIS